jgi:DNA repair protein RadC
MYRPFQTPIRIAFMKSTPEVLHITCSFTLHNHPTGDLTPSREDIEITRRLREAGDILGIKVVDHLIIDTETGRSNSFVSSGLM